VTSPPQRPERPEPVPTGRVVTWLVIAALLILGLVLYFRYGRDVGPALGLM
jgi:hypothetical protein